jgi:hypothetical protein
MFTRGIQFMPMSHSGFDKKELSNEPEIKLRCTLSRLCVLRCIHDVKLYLESTGKYHQRV